MKYVMCVCGIGCTGYTYWLPELYCIKRSCRDSVQLKLACGRTAAAVPIHAEAAVCRISHDQHLFLETSVFLVYGTFQLLGCAAARC